MRAEPRFRSVGAEGVGLINELTDSRLRVGEGEERVDMCKAIEDLRAEAREQGIEQGIEQNLLANARNLMRAVGWTARETLERLGVPEAERDRYLAML